MSLTKVSYSMIDGAPVNILDYGADPTGLADSSSAINAALDTGKSIFIPKGVYKIASAITPSSQQGIYGEGPKQSLLRADTVGMTVIDYPSGTYSNIEICNIGIDGNGKAEYGLSVYGSSTFSGSVSFCKFERLEAGDCTESAFYFRGITGCSVNDIASINGDGITPSVSNYAVFFQSCFNTMVSNCIFSSGKISTIGIAGGAQLIFNNVYAYNNGGGADSIMFVDGGFNHSFIDCGFEPQGAGGTTIAAVELKQAFPDVELQVGDINFVRCRWVGLAGTAPYNVSIGTVGNCFKTKFNECQFVKQGALVESVHLVGQAHTSFVNCVDLNGYYDLTYDPVTILNDSGNPYYQETLPGRFITPVSCDNEIVGDTIGPVSFLAPRTDDDVSCGLIGARWTVVYAASGSINTSDAREKQQERSLFESEKAVALKIKGLLKAFKFNSAVNKKGDKARIHFGVYAQEVAQAFESEGLNPHDYALFCYDEWEDNDKLNIKAGNRYGIRYEELLAFVISAL